MNTDLQNRINQFREFVDADFQYKFAKKYSQIGDHVMYGGKHAGSDAEHEGARFIAKILEEIGVSYEIFPMDSMRYQFNDASLILKDKIIKPYGYMSPGTSEKGIIGRLIDAGDGKKDFFESNNIKGAIVLICAHEATSGIAITLQAKMAEEAGASAVLVYTPDEIFSKEAIRLQYLNRVYKIPVVGISTKDAEYIKASIGNTETAHLIVDSELLAHGGTSYEIVATIPGESEEMILFTAHYDHFFRGVQDNIVSVATLLGIAKAMVESEQKLKRTMVFVFNGNHELGMVDSRYAYIKGSYNIAQLKKEEWNGKAILDLNFEANGVSVKGLRALGSYEYIDSYKEFLKYMPKTMPGFEFVDQEMDYNSYSIISWTDGMSMLDIGIPVIENDPLTDLYSEDKYIYQGREHTQFDNFDSYNSDALKSTSELFGAYALYMADQNIIPLNLGMRTDSIKFTESDRLLLQSEKINYEEFESRLNAFSAIGKNLYKAIYHSNKNKYALQNAENINSELLKIFKLFSKTFDKMGAQDFILVGHRKCFDNIALLDKVKKCIDNAQTEAALEPLSNVDISRLSLIADKNNIEILRDQICGSNYANQRSWNRGRELNCTSCYELINQIANKNRSDHDFSKELKLLNEIRNNELTELKSLLAEEAVCLNEITKEMKSVYDKYFNKQ